MMEHSEYINERERLMDVLASALHHGNYNLEMDTTKALKDLNERYYGEMRDIMAMNNRIKDLIAQATLKTPSKRMNPDTFEVEPWISYGQQIYHDVFDKEKFAELIVKDCTDLLEAEIKEQREMIVFNESDDRWRLGKVSHFTHVIKKIKAHFKGRV